MKLLRWRLTVKGRFFTLLFLFIAVAMLAVFNAEGTYLFFLGGDSSINIFDFPYHMVEIEENFPPFSEWKPGDEVSKTVSFFNTGELDAFLRVSYREAWRKTSDGAVVSSCFTYGSPAVEREAVSKTWTRVWPEYKGLDAAYEWTDGGDGYFYYNRILKANEGTGEIITAVTLADNAPSAYMRADYTLEFKVESLLSGARADIVKELWGKEPTVNGDGSVTWT